MNVETSVSGRRPVPWGKQDVFKHVWVFALTIWVSDRDYYVSTWLGIPKIELCGPKPCPSLNQVIYWGAQWAQRHQSNTEPYRICSVDSIFSSKGHCMNIVGHFQGLCFCNFGWGVPFVILWGMLIWYNYYYIYIYYTCFFLDIFTDTLYICALKPSLYVELPCRFSKLL